jgi:ABC-type transport system substrate-binding protein
VLRKSVEPATYYYGFNMRDPLLGRNKPLRQAMSMSLDRAKFIQDFLNGRGQPAIGPIPPGFPTYDPNHVNLYTRLDLVAARKLMAEAERINGGPMPPITLLMGDTDTEARQQADFFVSQMAQLGLTINVEYLTWARFQERVDNGQCQVFNLGWVADYPDEQTFLQLFYGKNATPGGINSTGYVSEQFDRLYEQAMVMNPSPQRDALYRQMDEIVMEDCPWITEFYPVAFSLSYDWLKNIGEMDYGNGMRQYLSLDEAARTKALAKR